MKLSLPARKLMLFITICTAAMIAIGIVLCFALPQLNTADILPVTLGLLLSAIIAAVKVYLLEIQVSKISNADETNKARGIGIGYGILRYALTFAAMAAAFYLIPFDKERHIYSPALIASVAGAFTWNISVYALKFAKLDEDAPAAPADPLSTEAAEGDTNEADTGENGENGMK